MANIQQTGGKVVGKLMTKLTELASDLVSKGKTSDEIRETLSQKVPGATSAQIDEAIAPTLLSKVEKGKELMVVEPGMARPVQPEPSAETALVPTGRGQTTFIAGERGVSAGGQAPSRTVEERIRSAATPKQEAVVIPPEASRPTFGTARKVGAGMVGAGVIGKAIGGGEEKEEKLPVYGVKPTIDEKGKLVPSKEELAAATDYDSFRKLQNTYDDLNKQVEQLPLEAYRSGASMPVQRAEKFLSSLKEAGKGAKATAPLVLSPEAMGLGPEAPAAPADKKATSQVAIPGTEKEKEKAATPLPSPGGVAPSKEATPSDTRVQDAVSQARLGTSAQGSLVGLEEKLKAGQPITRGDLLEVVNKFDNIKLKTVSADPKLLSSLQAAREEAKRAYREQATRNEWLEVAQTLGNAVANFIAAQRGVADRALALPSVDYNSRTLAALREYQTELGTIGEQERAVERETERRQRVSDRDVEIARRNQDKLLTLGEQALAAQERKAAQDQNYALQLKLIAARDVKANAAAQVKAAATTAKAATQGEKKYLSALSRDIAQTNSQLTEFEKKRAAAANVVNAEGKDFDKSFNEYAALLGLTKQEPTFQKEGWFGTPSFDKDTARKEVATQLALMNSQIAELRKRKADREREQQSILAGEAPSAPAPAPAPAGQKPATGGKVVTRKDVAEKAKQTGRSEAYIEQLARAQGFTIAD